MTIIAVGVALTLPSLTVGLVADDWLMELFLSDRVRLPGFSPQPLQLFTFASGEVEQTTALMNGGVFPWWTNPASKLSFFRPLTSATHWLDTRLLGDEGLPMHAHNLAWFAVTLVAVAWSYRRFLGAEAGIATATLALFFYAVDDAHGSAVGWVANRNAMLTTSLGLPALIVHDRWRRETWRPGAFLGPLLFAVALTAGEAATGVLAYVIAHAVHLDRAALPGRVRAIAGYLLVLAAYAGLVRVLGYGVHGSDLYIDPLGQPGRFMAAVVQRAPMLVLGQLALPWSDVTGSVTILWPRWTWAVALASAVAVGGLLWMMSAGLRRDRTARFFATGMILSCVPISGAFPADRLLWWTGFGGMAWVALFIATVVRGHDRPRSARILAAVLVLIHGVLSPFLLIARSRSMAFVGRPLASASRSLPADPQVMEKTFVLVNPPNDAVAAYLLIQRAADDVPRPRRVRWLAVGSTAVDLHRLDEHTLVVRQHGGFYGRATERMLRSLTHPFAPGDRVSLEDMDVTIQAIAPDGRPSVVRIRFDHRLEDHRYVWARWGDDGFEPYAPPSVGQGDHLPAVNQLRMLGLE